MKLITLPTDQIGKYVADQIITLINQKPDAVLGLATGSTPIPVYYELVTAYNRHEVSFADVKTFNLDEYCGLEPSDPHSYHYFMDKYLFSHIDIKPENTHFPPTNNSFGAFNGLLMSAPRDIQILGIGSNGHIAFVEPNRPQNLGVSRVTLSHQTRSDNARFFDSLENVPRRAVTMSISDIMYSKSLILIATGVQKAQAIATLLSHQSLHRTPSDLRAYPADWLYLHDNATVVCDPEALSLTSPDDLVPFLEK